MTCRIQSSIGGSYNGGGPGLRDKGVRRSEVLEGVRVGRVGGGEKGWIIDDVKG